MSTQPVPKPKAPNVPPSRQKKADMEPVDLMRAMGGNGWFNPQSNDMIRALRHLAKTQSLPRPMLVMYAWIVWQTTTSENRQPYANRGGVMLYLKDLADECGIEICNCRTYWRQGVQLGLWRNGEPDKGENAEGLYLCAKVATVEEEESPKAPEQVCTYLREEFLKKFKPYIREDLEKLPPESFQRFASEWDHVEEVGDFTHADLVAASRRVVGQIQDTLLRSVGIEQRRLDTAKNKSPEELAAASERQARIEKLLLPRVEEYVQTLRGCVPTRDPGQYTLQNGHVQTSGKGAQNGAASGAISVSKQTVTNGAAETHEQPPSLLESVRTSDSLRRAGGSSGPVKASGRVQSNDGKKSVQLHAGDPTTHVLQTLTHEEKDEADRVLLRTQALQKLYPKRWTGELLDPENKGDQVWSVLVVRALALREVDLFMGAHLEKRLLANALGNRVGLGLVLEWAGDFARGALDREHQRQAEADQEKKRLAFVEAAEARQKREDVILEQVESAWDALALGDRVERLRKVEQELKGDSHWQSVYRHNDEERRRVSELRAKRQLRTELEKSGGLR